jgi:hypothetical protein
MPGTVAASSTPHLEQLPLRTNTNIKGNVQAAFNKDYQMILFLRFPNADSGWKWLKDLLPSIAKNKNVADFNDQFNGVK